MRKTPSQSCGANAPAALPTDVRARVRQAEAGEIGTLVFRASDGNMWIVAVPEMPSGDARVYVGIVQAVASGTSGIQPASELERFTSSPDVS